jgi:serine carboxypeptidase-like clade 1
MSDQIGDVNIYNIYAPCVNSNRQLIKKKPYLNRKPIDPKHPLFGPDGCIDAAQADNYLNNDAVRSALHVQNSTNFPSWTICTNVDYSQTIDSLLPLYPTLISTYRVLIFNGDVDACVPYTGNEYWTSHLGYTVDEAWRPWEVNDQVAGYVTTYKAPPNGFTFLTIKGAGHMVPEYQPEAAFNFFQRYLANQPF